MRKDKRLLTYAFSLNCSGWTRKNVNIRTTSQSEIGTLFFVKLGHRMAALFGRRESKRGKLKGTVESCLRLFHFKYENSRCNIQVCHLSFVAHASPC